MRSGQAIHSSLSWIGGTAHLTRCSSCGRAGRHSEQTATISSGNRTREASHTFTEYSRALMAFESECESTLPTLRCTKSSPTLRPIAASATTRESEQPIHRCCGFCEAAHREKYSGSCSLCVDIQVLQPQHRSRTLPLPVGRSAGARPPCCAQTCYTADLKALGRLAVLWRAEARAKDVVRRGSWLYVTTRGTSGRVQA